MKNDFHQYLAATGSISRKNPELIRIAEVTGYTVEHLWKVATGARPPSKACAISISKAVGNKRITLASLGVEKKRSVQAPSPAGRARSAQNGARRAVGDRGA